MWQQMDAKENRVYIHNRVLSKKENYCNWQGKKVNYGGLCAELTDTEREKSDIFFCV